MIFRGWHYRIAQEEDEAPVQEQPAKFDWAAFAERLQEAPELLAQALVLGVAAALVNAGVKDKKQFGGSNNPQPLVSAFPKVIRALTSARQPFIQELRMLARLGPKTYLQRRGRALASMK